MGGGIAMGKIETARKLLKPGDRLIISIDVSNKSRLISMLKKIDGKVSTVKRGLELIYSQGLGIIKTVKSFGYRVMLDSKLMDIPNTVKKAAAAIGKLDVEMITLHTLGGKDMMSEAIQNLKIQETERLKRRPLLLGVTILTSLDDKDLGEMGFKNGFGNTVPGLVKIALEARLDGIICSPNEVKMIRNNFGEDFYIATPGIRLESDSSGDQKRINTPGQALIQGADFLVVGRSITEKADVGGAVKLYLEKIENAMGG